MGLVVCPLTLREANAYVERHHRHSVPVRGMKFAIAAAVGTVPGQPESGNSAAGRGTSSPAPPRPPQLDIVAVALVGRPVNRVLDDGWTMEVLRVCAAEREDGRGYPNACSVLYGASWRACRAMGYRRVITYTRADEPGTALLASNWKVVGEVDARSWDTPSRPRVDRDERQERLRWEPAYG